MILNLHKDSQSTEIIFDMYLKNSVYANGRKHREMSTEPVVVSMKRDEQTLPSAMDSFNPSEPNKEAL